MSKKQRAVIELELEPEELQFLVDLLWTRPRKEAPELWGKLVQIQKAWEAPTAVITTQKNDGKD